jgi:hypothetical protein
MLSYGTAGKDIKVTYTVTLAKTAALPAGKLETDFLVTLGIDPKSPAAKAIRKQFETEFGKRMNGPARAIEKRLRDARDELTGKVSSFSDVAGIEKYAERRQKEVIDEFNALVSGKVKRAALAAAEAAIKKSGDAAAKSLKASEMKFSSSDLKSSRVKVLTGVLAAATTLATGPPGWIAALSLAGAGLGSLRGALELKGKYFRQSAADAKLLEKDIADARKALDRAVQRTGRLTKANAAVGTEIARANVESQKIGKELEKARKEAAKNPKQKKGVDDATKRLGDLSKTIGAMRGDLIDTSAIGTLLTRAQSAVADAERIAEKQAGLSEGGESRVSKVLDDAKTGAGAIASLLKAFR